MTRLPDFDDDAGMLAWLGSELHAKLDAEFVEGQRRPATWLEILKHRARLGDREPLRSHLEEVLGDSEIAAAAAVNLKWPRGLKKEPYLRSGELLPADLIAAAVRDAKHIRDLWRQYYDGKMRRRPHDAAWFAGTLWELPDEDIEVVRERSLKPSGPRKKKPSGPQKPRAS